MDKQEDQLEALKEIRTLMDRSSRFLSLSGPSGIIAGIVALAGIVVAYLQLGLSIDEPAYYQKITGVLGEANRRMLIIDLSAVLIISVLGASILSLRKAKRTGQPSWDSTAKRLFINMALPLIAGGIYCAILYNQQHIEMIIPSTMIFYGFALLNASKYTLTDIRYLGILQVILGLVSSVYYDYALLFWGFGFGILHIVYGIAMYLKYDK